MIKSTWNSFRVPVPCTNMVAYNQPSLSLVSGDSIPLLFTPHPHKIKKNSTEKMQALIDLYLQAFNINLLISLSFDSIVNTIHFSSMYRKLQYLLLIKLIIVWYKREEMYMLIFMTVFTCNFVQLLC